jgi:hypothetical protein
LIACAPTAGLTDHPEIERLGLQLLVDKQAHRGADGKWVTIAVAWSGPRAGLE